MNKTVNAAFAEFALVLQSLHAMTTIDVENALKRFLTERERTFFLCDKLQFFANISAEDKYKIWEYLNV